MSLLLAVPAVRAELVFDEPQTNAVTDRENTRQVLESAERAQATQQAELQQVPTQVVQTVPVQQIQTIPVQQPILAMTPVEMAPAAPAVEVQHLSKAELLRRERMREELRNEDVLQERLEQLRLRDEQRRTNELLGQQPLPQVSTVPVGAQALVTEQVVAPVTERPGQPVEITRAAATDSIAVTQASAVAAPMSVAAVPANDDAASETTIVTVSPRLGLANMKGDAYMQVRPRYSAGLGIAAEISDNLSFETGYTFAEYGLIPAQESPLGMYARALTGGYYSYNQAVETRVMKQNTVDAGLKLHMLDRSAKLRPYLAGGAGYSWSYLNFDSRTIGFLRSMGMNSYSGLVDDYKMSSIAGFIGAGFDVRLSRSLSVGVGGRYYSVITSRENQQLPGMAFMNPYTMGNVSPMAANENWHKQMMGASLQRSGYYLVNAAVNFSF